MERETKALADLETALEETRAAALRGVPSSLSLTTPRLLRTAWAKREAQLRLVQAAEEGLRHHLRAVGAANVAALDELAAAAQLEALSAREAWQQVITHNPGLPPADLEADEDAERIRAAFERAEADASAARSAAEATRKAASEATEALARAQGSDPIDIAAVEVEIDEAQAELVRLELERDATALALDELSEASQLTFEGTARSLEVSSSERLRELSGVQGRRVEFDEEMRAFVIDGGGERLSVAQLSQGARDQLALAIRFALADLMAEQVALPMLLDDPFLNWDETRLAEAARALQSAATAGRQIWVLSHRPEFLAWGESVKVMPANG
jgi:DNA repair exonuclease SbcCD ATPase subunit